MEVACDERVIREMGAESCGGICWKCTIQLLVIPYLTFSGNCEEAVNTYMNAFGGEILGISRWTEKTYDKMPEQIGKVMHMDSETEALQAISVLAEGGIRLSPLHPHPEPDDGGCGSATRDRFGYTWFITCPNPAKQ